jgi:DNA-binding transcriptional LysR family regulator
MARAGDDTTSAAMSPGGHLRRSPQLDELRAFCTAVELGGIGRAAQRLRLTQPAVSKRLKAFEDLVGTALLERSAHGVTMTLAGERLYAHARKIAADMEELAAVLEQLGGARETVHLAISHTAAEFVMPKALVSMHRHTSAPVEVLIANSRVVKRMVRDGETDLGVAACTDGETVDVVENIPLLDDEIVVAVPLGHPWARRRSISPQELLHTAIVRRDPGSHTRQVIDETLDALGLGSLRVACEVGSTQAAKEEAHELGLPTLMSRLALSPADRLELVEVDGLRFKRRFCILHTHGVLSNGAAHLLRALQESAAVLTEGRALASQVGEAPGGQPEEGGA